MSTVLASTAKPPAQDHRNLRAVSESFAAPPHCFCGGSLVRRWDEIGAALGVTRQAAWERYNRRLKDHLVRNVAANDELGEVRTMQLVVEETRAVSRR